MWRARRRDFEGHKQADTHSAQVKAKRAGPFRSLPHLSIFWEARCREDQDPHRRRRRQHYNSSDPRVRQMPLPSVHSFVVVPVSCMRLQEALTLCLILLLEIRQYVVLLTPQVFLGRAVLFTYFLYALGIT